jgi:hypothetical protein
MVLSARPLDPLGVAKQDGGVLAQLGQHTTTVPVSAMPPASLRIA